MSQFWIGFVCGIASCLFASLSLAVVAYRFLSHGQLEDEDVQHEVFNWQMNRLRRADPDKLPDCPRCGQNEWNDVTNGYQCNECGYLDV